MHRVVAPISFSKLINHSAGNKFTGFADAYHEYVLINFLSYELILAAIVTYNGQLPNLATSLFFISFF